MPAFILWFLGPIGKWVGIALIAALAFDGLRTKWYFDDKASFTAKLEREANDAISKTTKARDGAVIRFDTGGMRNDGFRRD
jgi:hypothetical protein